MLAAGVEETVIETGSDATEQFVASKTMTEYAPLCVTTSVCAEAPLICPPSRVQEYDVYPAGAVSTPLLQKDVVPEGVMAGFGTLWTSTMRVDEAVQPFAFVTVTPRVTGLLPEGLKAIWYVPAPLVIVPPAIVHAYEPPETEVVTCALSPSVEAQTA